MRRRRLVRTAVLAVLVAAAVAGPVAPLAGASTAPDVRSAEPAGSGCAAVALFAVPATGETSADADPSVPVGELAGLATPFAQRWGDRAHVEYVAYPASLDRPLSYLASESRGVTALEQAMSSYADRCPAARLVVVGYSQGADVASDLVHRSARGSTVLRPEQFAGVVMLGSPRRDPKAPNLVEAPGRGILGPRPHRELDVFDGRVYEVCAVGDPICSTESLDLGVLREGLASGAHRSYPTLPVGANGTPLYEVLGRALDALVAAASGATPGDTAPVATVVASRDTIGG